MLDAPTDLTLFGFVNFALSMAFAFLAFGLWLRLLGRRDGA